MTDLTTLTVRTMPALLERVPATPALVLGRLNAPAETPGRPWLAPQPQPQPHPGGPVVDSLTAERLLGALERFVARHDWSAEPVPDLPQMRGGHRYAMVGSGGRESEALAAARLLEALLPGTAQRIAELAGGLAGHPDVAPLLAVGDGDEAAIAAAHGAAYLALGVAVAGAVVHQVRPPGAVNAAAAVVGLGIGAAVPLLREAPMPAAYADALLARIRREYLLPRHAHGQVQAEDHRFVLAEGELAGAADFSGTGLAHGTDGGVVIRTGVERGRLHVELRVEAEPPAPFPDETDEGWAWDTVAEVSWHAREGRAALGSLGRQTPPWPGDYRTRVYAKGRDDDDAGFERYRLVVWAAPAAPPVLWLGGDDLGRRLRGEAEVARAPRPELAYRWVSRSELQVGATVTIVTGSTLADVVLAFGADPKRPEPIDEVPMEHLVVLDAGDAVIAVENNGYLGSHPDVLAAASAGGRAASMFWNVNMVTRLSFAERGRIVAQDEPRGGATWPDELAGALAGLDFDAYGERAGKGLVAVERFTGRAFTEADFAAMRDAGIGYRLPE